MRRFYMISFLAFLFIGNIIAQEILEVDPGIGTLNTAVATYGGDRIYQLAAGEWYQLDAPIENVDYHLQIIGSEPAEPGGMPATLQTGSDVNGAVFSKMFDAKGDITLKNIFFVNADLSAQVAFEWLVESDSAARIVVDRCILHPACVGQAISGAGGVNKCYFTNNQAIGHGHMLSPNDGHFFNFSNTSAGEGFDTLWVENNTFVCMGMNVFQGSFGDMVNNVVAFNHNTFVFAKSQIDWTTKKMEEYWTNNLMFDLQVDPYANNWQPMPGGDPSMPKPNLIYADTLEGEVMPSTRPNFVQYNSLYRAQGFYDLVDEMNIFCAEQDPPLPGVYLYPLVWPRDTLTSREAQMFGSEDFPKFKFGNYIADVDPEWNDAAIYDHEAMFVEWASPANYIHALGQPSENYPPATEWPQYWWIPSGDLSNNSVWPLFDGTYTNEQTLKGSIEINVPLGDLNWWPEAKAAWELKKADVWAHIQAGNTDQIDIGYGTTAATVVDIIVASPDHETLEAAVIAAELADDLSGEGPFTVFAPTDDAFAALPEGTLDALLEDPTGDLANILLYHVLSGKVMSTDLSDGQVATTLLGEDITVTINNDGVFINEAKVTVADLEADNGVVHVIDAVLIPEAATGTVDVKSEGLLVYPNPAKDILNVKGSKNADITIMNIDGRIVRTVKNVSSVNISDLANGMYSVTIKEGNKVAQQKVLIAR